MFKKLTSICSEDVCIRPLLPLSPPAPSKISNCLNVHERYSNIIKILKELWLLNLLPYSYIFNCYYLQSPPITLLKHVPCLRSKQLVPSNEIS